MLAIRIVCTVAGGEAHHQELVREVLDCVKIQCPPVAMGIHVFLQVLFAELRALADSPLPSSGS